MDYIKFFSQATRLDSPYPYQHRLANEPWPELLDIPTGLGKTAAVTLAWIYKRRFLQDTETPRRLVWCLPMRVLGEQTAEAARTWLDRLGLLGEPCEGKVSVHLLMGGEDDLDTWAEWPEEDMILIGTQDMLLSRALMRGYGMSRYQWPVQFAFLHNDALWVFDEVQLMGPGLATSAQLDAFRRSLPLGATSRSLWVSATLNRDWLATVDLRALLPDFRTLTLTPEEASSEAIRARRKSVKRLHRAEVELIAENAKGAAKTYAGALADEMLKRYRPGTQTLAILNTVERAQALYRAIAKSRPSTIGRGVGGEGTAHNAPQLLLVHARFRPEERRRINAALRDIPPEGRIVVATQAIEAGVDVTSRVLFTELSPWSSLVQRFGRCNRYGEWGDEGADVYWVDIAEDAILARPYEPEALALAREKLAMLASAASADLPPTDEAAPLFSVLRRKDFLDVFNTDPDLSGFDLDISPYIRDAEDADLQVFWRLEGEDWATQPPPVRDELCRLSIGQAQTFFKNRDAWRWDSLTGRWEKLSSEKKKAVFPGLTLLLDATQGGYELRLGLCSESKVAVTVVAPSMPAQQSENYDGDWRSRQPKPVELNHHLLHVEDEAEALCKTMSMESLARQSVQLAARWHDVGKAHPVFQTTMHDCALERLAEGAPLLAKSASRCRHARPHFRHELASMLAWLAHHDGDGEFDADLIAYLILAHHGKVRTSLRALPDEKEPESPHGPRFVRGVWEGDVLPGFGIGKRDAVGELTLKLELMDLGESKQGPSWTARVARLLERYGPFQLAWLESLVRIVDWRASRKEQED